MRVLSHAFRDFPGSCQLDHILPRAAEGLDEEQNLCSCCAKCNQHKAAKLVAIDPLSGAMTPLFHPRRDRWHDHFAWIERGTCLVGLTPAGRATVIALQINDPPIVAARRLWVHAGWHPPPDDPVLGQDSVA